MVADGHVVSRCKLVLMVERCDDDGAMVLLASVMEQRAFGWLTCWLAWKMNMAYGLYSFRSVA